MRPTKREREAESARKGRTFDWVHTERMRATGESGGRGQKLVENVRILLAKVKIGPISLNPLMAQIPRSSLLRAVEFLVKTQQAKLLEDGRLASYDYTGEEERIQQLEREIEDVIWTHRTEKFREPTEKRIAKFAHTTQEDLAFNKALTKVANKTRWESVEVSNILRYARRRNENVAWDPHQFGEIQAGMISQLGKIMTIPTRYQEIVKKTLGRLTNRGEPGFARLNRLALEAGILTR
jgi:hypothetical protein